ncbi:MAG: DUF4956 domain-containing protein [Lachnospiraceae bacterium]|nr:DUF4956 domain-containing protein [Lachnospiraceae bacterium]
MDLLNLTFENIRGAFETTSVTTSVILSVLLFSILLSAYEFAVYRLVSHRAFYNRSFNISITVMPIFIATIILCLQSSIVITLGTIGALAIIRYRTAVKDPVDMIYLLWSIHTGIVCGCQLYMVGLLTSIAATLVLIALENLRINKKPLILVFESLPEKEQDILDLLRSVYKKVEVKSRNFSNGTIRYTTEVSGASSDILTKQLEDAGAVSFSLISYDEDSIM